MVSEYHGQRILNDKQQKIIGRLRWCFSLRIITSYNTVESREYGTENNQQ